MRLNAAERESFRKRLKMFFVNKPNIKKKQIVNHFEKKDLLEVQYMIT